MPSVNRAAKSGPAKGKERIEAPINSRSETMLSPEFSAETAAQLMRSRTTEQALHDDVFVDQWVQSKLKRARIHSLFIPISEVKNWHFDPATGNITHDSGRFFTVMGLQVRHRCGSEEVVWDQPVLDQPEIGILGIAAKECDGVLHFCLRAKEEPGNINAVQLSPTVQATYSNYSRVHGGAPPPFIELFLDPPRDRVLFAKLQTEDGGRFLFKSNRNMIVRVGSNEMAKLPDDFIWLTLRQISALMRRDNMINSCARSVLCCLL